jgi:hypothetical protein
MSQWKEAGASIVIALALAAAVGVVALNYFPTSSIESILTGTPTSVASRTLPCGSPSVYCGGANIRSASLIVNGNNSVLQLTLDETGTMYIGSATVYLNGTVIGVPPASDNEPPGNINLNVQPGQQTVVVMTIPSSTVMIQAGRNYSVIAYTWEGPPDQRASDGNQESVIVTAK